jgi:hypothetical protein
MWELILLLLVLLVIAAMAFLPNIGALTGGKVFDNAPAKCASCPKQAAREAADSQ